MQFLKHLKIYRTKDILFGKQNVVINIEQRPVYTKDGYWVDSKITTTLVTKPNYIICKSKDKKIATNILTGAQMKFDTFCYAGCNNGDSLFIPRYTASDFFPEQKYVSKKQLIKQLRKLNRTIEEEK